jgi:hypothetical protein
MTTIIERAGGGDKKVDPAVKAMKAARKAHREMGPKVYWWIVTGLVFVIGLLHLIGLARAWMIRRRGARRLVETHSSATSSPTLAATNEKGGPLSLPSAPPAVPRAQPGLSTAARAGRALFNNYAYVRVFPLWIFSHTSAAEMWWTAAYTGIVLGLAFWSARFNGVMDYANPMGYAVSSEL